jgi:g-D-glutamyl-meso-diaminopimelate peptidase
MNSGPTLTIGSTGPDVRRLQIIFVMTKLLGVSGIDGIFGHKTLDAVKSFQQGSNLTADGVVGPMTWRRFQRTRKHRDWRAAQPAVRYPRCKKGC